MITIVQSAPVVELQENKGETKAVKPRTWGAGAKKEKDDAQQESDDESSEAQAKKKSTPVGTANKSNKAEGKESEDDAGDEGEVVVVGVIKGPDHDKKEVLSR
jgi:hypothetical protein